MDGTGRRRPPPRALARVGWAAQALCMYAAVQPCVVSFPGEQVRDAIWAGADLALIAGELPLLIVMLLLAADALITSGAVLRGYCFARAETRERESLAAYLESETGRPLRRWLRREQLPRVGVLATLLLLLGRYGLLF